jgi:hypothetical protein
LAEFGEHRLFSFDGQASVAPTVRTFSEETIGNTTSTLAAENAFVGSAEKALTTKRMNGLT